MVKEFPELQGIVGGLYAKAQGEGDPVSAAIYDHYKPVSMEDSIPRTREGQIVAVADKLDTLRECFRIGLIPTGSKDPFALRRAAQGVVRILFESELPVDLMGMLRDQASLAAFMNERISYYLREVKSYPYDEVNAVMASESTAISDLLRRIEAVHQARATDDFASVAASFKRIKNILAQANFEERTPIETSSLQAGPERELYEAALRVRSTQTNSYNDQLEAIASLRPQVDLFFDKILVNDPDPEIRRNRLALLHSLLSEFSTIADFSEIVTQGSGELRI